MRAIQSIEQPGALRGLCGLIAAFTLLMILGQVIATRRAAPATSVRIAATLVSWGLPIDGLSVPVSTNEIDRHVARLKSPDGEERVRAANWLASRGVREAGPHIAAAMADAGTLRPCQLAHSLGRLGDDQWTGLLVAAAKQTRNLDLGACATIALCEIASPSSVDALIDLCRAGEMRWTTLEALGRIGDSSALGFLQSVAASPRDEAERKIALLAIERIELMQRVDPVPDLVARVRKVHAGARLDSWAVRAIAKRNDVRGVPALRKALSRPQVASDDRILLAAGLLALGEDGLTALREIVDAQPQSRAGRTALAALSLVETTKDAHTIASR
ncbi:MAG: HEAT repeat domain-containing protein [Planctomycetes bacterium]|nr:HEAT repeat domain-containing protein [Planctomycetota bacterium]